MEMKILIKYTNPEDDVLEIGFYRGNTMIYNVFCGISGLNEEELTELKKEAITKFCACFPDISLKEVMKGFSAVDPIMERLYIETFNPKRAGRKQGKKIGKIKENTILFARRVTLREKIFLEKCLNDYRQENKNKK